MAEHVDIRAQLAIGRSAFDVGRVLEISEWICDYPRRIPRLVELMWDDDPGVASRAADVLERIMRQPSHALRRAVAGHKDALMGLLSEAQLPKVRWNLALTIPRIELTVPECRRVASVLRTWFDDLSSIVKTAALHGIAELTRQDPASLPAVLDLLRAAGRSGTPAMRARSRILLKKLERPPETRRAHTGLHMFG
jgi:HEAT repeat protein